MDKLLIRIARAFGFKIAQQRKDFHSSYWGHGEGLVLLMTILYEFCTGDHLYFYLVESTIHFSRRTGTLAFLSAFSQGSRKVLKIS